MPNSAAIAGQLRRERWEDGFEDEDGLEDEYDSSTASKTGDVKDTTRSVGGFTKTTNMLLRAAWFNLITSFGFTLIYINTHVFMHFLFPKLFCKLGEEWIPGQGMFGPLEEGTKSAKRTIGMVETMLLIALDLGLMLILLVFLAIIMVIIEITSTFFGAIMSWYYL